MKTTFKQIATGTFIAILLMVGNVNATELKSSIRESIEIETTLQIENWMLNDMVSINIAEFVLETEPVMEIESWMTNAEMWNFNSIFVEETETAIQLEGWMTNNATWNTVKIDKEPKLKVENWMVNDSIWE